MTRTRPLALLASFVALATAAPAQLTDVWTFGYRAPGDTFHRIPSAVATPDGGLVTVTSTVPDESSNFATTTVTKFSENGDRSWEVTRSASHCAANCLGVVHPTADVDGAGNVYLGYFDGGRNRVAKFGPAGGQLWDVVLDVPGFTSFAATQLVVDSTDHVVVGGTRDIALYPYAMALKVDPSGNIVWVAGGDLRGEVTGVALGPNDEVALYGRDDYPGFGNFYGRIFVHRADGTRKWTSSLSSGGYATLNFGTYWWDTVTGVSYDDQGRLWAFTNGNFAYEWLGVFDTGFALARFDPSGAPDFRTSVSSDLGTWGARIQADALGNAYVVGAESPSASANPQTALWKINGAGTLDWQRSDPAATPAGSLARALALTPGGDVLLTQATRDDAQGGELLFDPFGTLVWRRDAPTVYSNSFGYGYGNRDHVVEGTGRHMYAVRVTGLETAVAKLAPGGVIGTSYCAPAIPNSTGSPGSIRALGEAGAVDDNVSLVLSGLPPSTFAMVVTSRTQAAVPMAGGSQGTLCLGGSIGRYGTLAELRRVRLDGTASFRVDLAAIPDGPGTVAASAGQTWNFQAWYRDANPSATSNFTDAVALLLQ